MESGTLCSHTSHPHGSGVIFLAGPGAYHLTLSFPSGTDGKESAGNVGDLGLIHGSGKSPREENGNRLQYSCLENPMDRGAWWATVHGIF